MANEKDRQAERDTNLPTHRWRFDRQRRKDDMLEQTENGDRAPKQTFGDRHPFIAERLFGPARVNVSNIAAPGERQPVQSPPQTRPAAAEVLIGKIYNFCVFS